MPPSPFTPLLRPLRLRSNIRTHLRQNSSQAGPSTTASKNAFRLTPTTAVLCCVPLLTGFLGVWQLQRLQWKFRLIEEVDKGMAKDPMILPDDINISALPSFAFRRVLLRGHFLPSYLLIGPRVYDGFPGSNLIQPFLRTPSPSSPSASTILVNRGFITSTRVAALREGREEPRQPLAGGRAEGELELAGEGEEVFLVGMVRREGGQGLFTPDNEVEAGNWFWNDVSAMAEHFGGEKEGIQPVLVDEIYDDHTPTSMLLQKGIPVGRPPVVELRNMHATYAATWLSLSAATSILLARLIMKGRGSAAVKGGNPRLQNRRI